MGKYAKLPQIARLFDVEPRWINRLVKEHGMPKEAHGEYDVEKCVKWYIAYLRKQLDDAKGGSYKSAKERQANAFAERAELEAAQKRGELIKVDDVIPLIEKIVLIVKTQLNKQPKRLAPKTMMVKDIKSCEKIISKDVELIFNELSQITYSPGSMAKHK